MLKRAVHSIFNVIFDVPRQILMVLLKLYRLLISPLYGRVCRFFPSCSAYALEAVTVHGAIRGSWLTLKRVGKCHPWHAGGVDPVPSGGRTWEAGKEPWILKLNHPVLAPDPVEENSTLVEIKATSSTSSPSDLIHSQDLPGQSQAAA